jgi:hypothetical protein
MQRAGFSKKKVIEGRPTVEEGALPDDGVINRVLNGFHGQPITRLSKAYVSDKQGHVISKNSFIGRNWG